MARLPGGSLLFALQRSGPGEKGEPQLPSSLPTKDYIFCNPFSSLASLTQCWRQTSSGRGLYPKGSARATIVNCSIGLVVVECCKRAGLVLSCITVQPWRGLWAAQGSQLLKRAIGNSSPGKENHSDQAELRKDLPLSVTVFWLLVKAVYERGNILRNLSNFTAPNAKPTHSTPRTIRQHTRTCIHTYIYIYCPPYVDRIWGMWGSYSSLPKAIFYLL